MSNLETVTTLEKSPSIDTHEMNPQKPVKTRKSAAGRRSKKTTTASELRPNEIVVQPSKRGRGNSTYPWADMKPLDSFVVAAPRKKEARDALFEKVQQSAYTFSRDKTGGKAEFVHKGVKNGIKSWRVV